MSIKDAKDKRESLKKAAIQLAFEHGLHNWTQQELAERAGVPLGNVYYYFKSQDELKEFIAQVVTNASVLTSSYLELLPDRLKTSDELTALKWARLDIDIRLAQLGEISIKSNGRKRL